MPLKIAQLGQPVLRNVTEEIPAGEIASPDVQELVSGMIETMDSAGGVGLAAPQVFREERLFVAKILPSRGQEGRTEVFINPKLTELSEDVELGWEGCLSFLELLVLVPRHTSLRIDYFDRNGEEKALHLTGFPARVVQHEFDHLDGILTIDRARTTRDIIKASEADDVIGEE